MKVLMDFDRILVDEKMHLIIGRKAGMNVHPRKDEKFFRRENEKYK